MWNRIRYHTVKAKEYPEEVSLFQKGYLLGSPYNTEPSWSSLCTNSQVIFFHSGVIHGGESIRVQQHTDEGAEGRWLLIQMSTLNISFTAKWQVSIAAHTYSGILISWTSKGNANWFEKSGVREIEGDIKLCLIGRVSGYCLIMGKCSNFNKIHPFQCRTWPLFTNKMYLKTKPERNRHRSCRESL